MKNTLTALIFTLISMISFAQNDAKNLKNFNLKNKVALSGYDPVSYFSGKPAKGNPKLAASFESVVYLFATQTNKDLFIKNAADYTPKYGGWCAFAMGDSGDKVEVNPLTYKIIDKKLYLFYNAYLTNTLKSWNKDEKKLKAQADANWNKIDN